MTRIIKQCNDKNNESPKPKESTQPFISWETISKIQGFKIDTNNCILVKVTQLYSFYIILKTLYFVSNLTRIRPQGL